MRTILSWETCAAAILPGAKLRVHRFIAGRSAANGMLASPPRPGAALAPARVPSYHSRLPMRVLFVDVDGVLVTARSQFAQRRLRAPDREAVAMLVAIACAATARLVISSSWREGETRSSFRSRLDALGLPEDLLHDDWATPVLRDARQLEIDDWLRRHPEVTHYAILDDGVGLDDTSPHLIRTEYDDGLQFRHGLLTCAVLGVDVEAWCVQAGVKFTPGDRRLVQAIHTRVEERRSGGRGAR